MNVRLLLVVAALSATLITLNTSCGGSTCSPATCSAGCCTPDGVCRAGSSNSACGGKGAFCSVCTTGEVCQSSACVTATTGTGGGAGGGNSTCAQQGKCETSTGSCGQACSDGCCVPNDPQGRCSTEANNQFCGAFGATCISCGTGETCTATTGGTFCGTGAGGGSGGGTGGGTGGGSGGGAGGGAGGGGGSTGPQDIGGACTGNPGCISNDCLLTAPGGYCTLDCASAVCPVGSSCSSTFLSGGPGCMSNCPNPGMGQDVCRPGYVCEKYFIAGSQQGTCFPSCPASACPADVAPTCENGYCCGGPKFKCCSGAQPCISGAACGSDGYCPP